MTKRATNHEVTMHESAVLQMKHALSGQTGSRKGAAQGRDRDAPAATAPGHALRRAPQGNPQAILPAAHTRKDAVVKLTQDENTLM